ncbi:glycosyltransferase family 4 protein [Poseidonocella sp. HB161398]|uniref:glycosyltransferase family 4 protein n=1 Tax=Poseidonocella sp. HB161398 TaxID=2320855 RepID=UPI001107C0E9|nr:glycosyltransferase family 4 protein [Poseidonocella sp. HB161398]
MRVLVLAPQPFYIPRGTPIAVRALMRSLAAQGHEVDAIVYPEGEDPEIEGARIFRLARLPGTKDVPPGFSLKKAALDSIMLPAAAWRLWRGKYDLVIAVEEAAFIALLLKPFLRVPYLCDVDSSIPEQLSDKYVIPRWLHRIISWAEARAARGAIGAITCCRALQDLVEGYAPGLPVQTLEDITLVEAARGAPEDCRFADPVIMYIGNLEGYQGVELLLRGFALASSRDLRARLVIIGGGETQIRALEALADELGVAGRVSLLGARPVEQIGDYLSQASIVVSPRTQGQNTPMKIYSYLDSGRPLLATRLPTHTQVLDDSIAMLVEPTPEDMARGMTALLGNAALSGQLADAAREKVATEFSAEAYSRKLRDFIVQRIEPQLAARG